MTDLCDEFSHILLDVKMSKSMKNVLVLRAIINSIDRDNEIKTAEISYETNPHDSSEYPELKTDEVPFFYHCEYSTGTEEDLADGHLAFAVDDIVYVFHFTEGAEEGNTYIVGHADISSIKFCLPDMLRLVLGNNEVVGHPQSVTYLDAVTGITIIPVMQDGSDPGFTFPTYLDNSLFELWEADAVEEYVPEDDFTTDYFVRVADGEMINKGGGSDYFYTIPGVLIDDESSRCLYMATSILDEDNPNDPDPEEPISTQYWFVNDKLEEDISELTYIDKYGTVIDYLTVEYDVASVSQQYVNYAFPSYLGKNRTLYCGYNCSEEASIGMSTSGQLCYFDYGGGFTSTSSGYVDEDTEEVFGGEENDYPIKYMAFGYSPSGEPEISHDLWYIGSDVAGVFRNTLSFYSQEYENTRESPGAARSVIHLGEFNFEYTDDAYTSVEKTFNPVGFTVVSPWGMTPYFDEKLTLIYGFSPNYITYTVYTRDDVNGDGYNDSQRTTIMKADTRVHAPGYNEQRLPINNCSIAIGRNGIYGVSATLAFIESMYVNWFRIKSGADNSTIEESEVSTYTFDNPIYGVDAAMNPNTALFDSDTLEPLPVMAGFVDNSALKTGVQDYLEAHVAEIYPNGEVTSNQHIGYGNYYWVLDVKVYHRKRS